MHLVFRYPPPDSPAFQAAGNRPPAGNPPSEPDYQALVDVILDLRQFPDNAGETILNPDEAERIRATGWSARAGTWRCPTIPGEFIAPYRPLWCLDDAIDPNARPIPWRLRRAVFRRISPVDPLSTLDHRLLGLLRPPLPAMPGINDEETFLPLAAYKPDTTI